MPREDQVILSSRGDQSEIDLNKAQIINFAMANGDIVVIGTIVCLTNASDENVEYAIVDAWNGDPDNNVLSS
jgi:transcription elongation GreA/GreB family factor